MTARRRRALKTGASARGLHPISRMASASSAPARDEFITYDERTSPLTPAIVPSVRVSSAPSRFMRSLRATIASASASFPAMARTAPPLAARASEAAASACSHLTGARAPSAFLASGMLSRWRLRPSYWNRALSEIHSSFTSSFSRGTMRMTSVPRVSTRMLQPSASLTSTDSTPLSSQFRAVKAYGLEVRAPTGHRSITFPESSLAMSFST